MTVKDTVEARILDLQERKRELANATIEGKTAAGKLTMNDMLALFGHDAEARWSDDRDDLDFSGKARLLNSKEKEERAASASASTSRRASPPIMESRGKGKKPAQENSVYGRRW